MKQPTLYISMAVACVVFVVMASLPTVDSAATMALRSVSGKTARAAESLENFGFTLFSEEVAAVEENNTRNRSNLLSVREALVNHTSKHSHAQATVKYMDIRELYNAAYAHVQDARYGMACVAWVALWITTATVMAGLLHDVVAFWMHQAHFRSCQKKVQNVHKVLLNRIGDDLCLCPYCVEPISVGGHAPPRIAFLCGHAFHESCMKTLLREKNAGKGCRAGGVSDLQGEMSTAALPRCPICEECGANPSTHCKTGTSTNPISANLFGSMGARLIPRELQIVQPGSFKTRATSLTSVSIDVADARDCVDERHSCADDRAFMLRSLHRMYPKIVPEERLQRWGLCTTETWLSEMVYPRHASIFKGYKKSTT